MADVTIDLLYAEIKRVHKELHELRGSLIPVEKISEKEHVELDEIETEMRSGKTTPWRDAFKELVACFQSS